MSFHFQVLPDLVQVGPKRRGGAQHAHGESFVTFWHQIATYIFEIRTATKWAMQQQPLAVELIAEARSQHRCNQGLRLDAALCLPMLPKSSLLRRAVVFARKQRTCASRLCVLAHACWSSSRSRAMTCHRRAKCNPCVVAHARA